MRDGSDVVLVRATAAIVIDAVAAGVAWRGRAGGAAVLQPAAHAAGRAVCRASAQAAASRGRDEVFVLLAIAVVVYPVAARVSGRSNAGRAAVADDTAHAA